MEENVVQELTNELNTNLNFEYSNLENYNVYNDYKNIKMPGPMWGVHTDGTNKLIFTHVNGLQNDKCVLIETSTTAKVIH